MTKDTTRKLADACMRVGCANIIAHKDEMAGVDIKFLRESLREAERGILEVLVEVMREVES